MAQLFEFFDRAVDLRHARLPALGHFGPLALETMLVFFERLGMTHAESLGLGFVLFIKLTKQRGIFLFEFLQGLIAPSDQIGHLFGKRLFGPLQFSFFAIFDARHGRGVGFLGLLDLRLVARLDGGV